MEFVIVADSTDEKWDWNSAQELLVLLQMSEFIMAFVIVKNCFSVLRGMTVKQQKRDIDIVTALSDRRHYERDH